MFLGLWLVISIPQRLEEMIQIDDYADIVSNQFKQKRQLQGGPPYDRYKWSYDPYKWPYKWGSLGYFHPYISGGVVISSYL